MGAVAGFLIYMIPRFRKSWAAARNAAVAGAISSLGAGIAEN
jgi:hypothetical protein